MLETLHQHRRPLTLLLALAVLVILADVFAFGIAHVDTASYTDQITSMRHGTFLSSDQAAEYRAFKPLYATVGIALPFLSPDLILLGMNALFLCGLGIIMYFFLLELGFAATYAFLGGVWTLIGYPALQFGFALGTDISGWFFAPLTMLIVLVAIRKNENRLLVLASLVGFLGAASKETGVIGLFFGGLYLLLRYPREGFDRTLRSLIALCLPFCILEGILLLAIHFSGLIGFAGWVGLNNGLYESVHTVKFFLGAELATFNILWLLVLAGAYALARKSIVLGRERALQLTALFVAALPVIEWPAFNDRILFSQFFIVVPLALLGAQCVTDTFAAPTHKRWFWYALYALPLIASIALVLIGGHDGIYALLHRLAHRV